ncbi:phosphatase PAP2 family protein [Pedobacter sp. HMF7647]|uniref:Phosphatase PAP2 family protein n=1 Tax=Hufsiella arboris TaxID=2695275 RepID=A0A7K1YBJ6_9SPHI|nr:phosphatase PAP2 family protein [Hufsiella arboris]MXV51956.1 phosphatase PAP2 family protein [Hufsiella arboris]
MKALKSIWTVYLSVISVFGFSQGITSQHTSDNLPDTVTFQRPANVRHNPALAAITFIPPAICVGYGIASLNSPSLRQVDHFVYNDMQEDHPQFQVHIDDYLQFAPAMAVYGLNIAGVKGRHATGDQTALLLISSAIMSSSVFVLKNHTNQLRPNGSNNNSFPSGHTATAFAGAEFLNQEYGDVSFWYGAAGYAMATATGVLRVYNNEHWFSNIIAGAGIGIVSTKLTYLMYPYIKRAVAGNKTLKSVLIPSYQHGFVLTYSRQL